ncbi:hypothetical protein EYF80_025202 [Liparis tanakae]|uniref:Uncharacterized protein n=1 Tax=Liparis tanakae TaxID=230148 RepID=A0A4Z2HH36_9TELE|nr:hypothetical protein EYF80_025202 [Liparis tanakae]
MTAAGRQAGKLWFCHINMNLGLQGFTVPQAAACSVCLGCSSVTMVTDARPVSSWHRAPSSGSQCRLSVLAV